MKVNMSPEAIENRLKLVGELTRACLLLGQNKLKNDKKKEQKRRQSTKDEVARCKSIKGFSF